MSSTPNLQRRIQGTLLSSEEVCELSELFIKWTGNKFGSDKQTLLESRIIKRLNETRLPPSAYIAFVKKDAHERELFISALTTHKTDWFREPVHIKFLVDKVQGLGLAKQRNPLTIWSAACSSGEEVYSICMALLSKDVTQFRVLGTDISECCLKKARSGVFAATQVDEQVPKRLRDLYFHRSIQVKGKSEYRIAENFQQWVKWRRFNLLEDKLSAKVQFDFIFLRNVLIYFKPEDIHKIIGNLCAYLKPGGFLITGLSEHIAAEEQHNLKRVGNSIYRYEG